MKLSDLLAKFDDVHAEADGYVALCPAHSDSKPSLRIAISTDGKAMLACRAGCKTPDVVRLSRADWPDLFDIETDGAVRLADAAKAPPAAAAQAGLSSYVLRAAARLQDGSEGAARALAYLAERFGIDKHAAAEFRLGYDAGGFGEHGDPFEYLGAPYRRFARVVVPFLDADGIPRGLQGRDLTGACPVRWCGLSNPDGAAWSKTAVFRAGTGIDDVLVTEGPGDGLTAAAVGYDAVGVRGAALANRGEALAEVLPFLQGRRVVVAGDADTAGEGFTRRLAAHLHAEGLAVFVLKPPAGEDLTSWRKADPAAFASALHAAVKAAEPYREPRKDTGPAEAPAKPSKPATDATVALPKTELGNAIRVVGKLDGDGRPIRYTPALGFLEWTGSHWRAGAEPSVRFAVQEHALELERQAVGELAAAGAEPPKALVAALRAARDAQRSTAINGTLNEIKARPGVRVDVHLLDADPDILAARNGIIDLRTGELRPATPDDLVTKALDIDYDPEATAPRWEQFLSEVFPENDELPAYMRRLVGYGITGHNREQCFALLYGSGANGKSVFTSALYDVFKPITANVGIETFLSAGNESAGGAASPDIASLRGERLVLTSESEHGSRLAEARLKRLTGGDPITARHLYRDQFSFVPSFLLMLSTNGLPEIRGNDDGIWRRIKVIEFKARFSGAKRDNTLGAKLHAERAGILAWAVRGAVEWYSKGLGEPRAVAQTVSAYREESDRLSGFYPGKLRDDPEGWLSRADIYEAYTEWFAAQGNDPSRRWTNQAVFSVLRSAGLKPAGRKGTRGFAGVRLEVPTDHRDDGSTPAEPSPALGESKGTGPSLDEL